MNKYKTQKPFCLWFTGLPSSGKTTLAKSLVGELFQGGVGVMHLDGDNLRTGLCSDLGFSKKDREENNRRAIFVAKLALENNIPAIVSFISPYEKTRNYAKKIIPNTSIIFINCSIEECKKRDVKGLYGKAAKGEIKHMTGVDDIYEVPKKPDLIIDTYNNDLKKCTAQLLEFLMEQKYLHN